MSLWRKQSAKKTLPNYIRDEAGYGGKIPKGYIPMVLVGDKEETRVLVHVKALEEPCMAAMLEMAEQQFGYGQQGVLRIPCGVQQFQQMVHTMCSKTTQ